jgi:transcriptional regulator with XRE-family HTH domain
MLSLGENVKKIRLSKGFTRAEIMKMTGIKNLYQKETGIRKINEKDLTKLSIALNCLKSDFLGDTEQFKNVPNDVKLINMYDLKHMKDTNIENYDNIADTIAISTRYLQDVVGSENIILVKCYNNLMYPFLQHSDNIFIDIDCKKFINNGIFMLKENDNFVIKRASKKELFKNVITLSYDNTTQGSLLTEINDEDFINNLIGRVIYFGRNIKDL